MLRWSTVQPVLSWTACCIYVCVSIGRSPSDKDEDRVSLGIYFRLVTQLVPKGLM